MNKLKKFYFGKVIGWVDNIEDIKRNILIRSECIERRNNDVSIFKFITIPFILDLSAVDKTGMN